MSKIAEFLTHFDDQHLANLQCAAEDGRLSYADSCNCLLHHFNGEYSITKWQGDLSPLAKQAEWEFLYIGRIDDGSGGACYRSEISEPKRRAAILPLIQAEWTRRGRVPHHDWHKVGQESNEMAEFTKVSPAVR